MGCVCWVLASVVYTDGDHTLEHSAIVRMRQLDVTRACLPIGVNSLDEISRTKHTHYPLVQCPYDTQKSLLLAQKYAKQAPKCR